MASVADIPSLVGVSSGIAASADVSSIATRKCASRAGVRASSAVSRGHVS